MKSESELVEIGLSSLKEAIHNSNLNYFISESPFSLNLRLRKTLISRHSLDSSTPLKSSFVQTTLHNIQSQKNVSSNISVNDSGIQSDLENIKEQLDDAQKQVVSTVLDCGQQVRDLELQIESKNSVIKKLETNLRSETEEINKVKSDLKTKNEQLKNKNKSLDNANLKIETVEKQMETLRTNLNKKIINFERKNKCLSEDLEEKKLEFKKEKNALKKVISEKDAPKKTKTSSKETQTIQPQMKSQKKETPNPK